MGAVEDRRIAVLEAEVRRLRDRLHNTNAVLNKLVELLDQAGLVDTRFLRR